MLTVATPPSVLSQLSDFVAAKLGLSFTAERWRDLERALRPAATEMGFDSVASYARWLLTAPLARSDLEALAARLTVGETYFFREPLAFDALRENIVPELVLSHRVQLSQLRVWSAGCCTGEEAYSLAIFFDRLRPELRGCRIGILGTDINPHFLRKAREGIYRGWSFRGAPAWLQAEYFTPLSGDRFELRSDIRRMVTFEPLNLAEDGYPSLHNQTNGMDLIFCRNVLMYFSPAQARRTIAGFHRSLVEGGHLVVGVCEASSTLCPQYQSRAFPGATVYQKDKSFARRMAGSPPSPIAPPFIFDSAPTSEPPTTAAEAFSPCVASLSSRMPTAIRQAEELFRNGDYAAAIERLQAALAPGSFDVDAAALLARAHANQGDLAEARRWIERALVVDRLRAPLHHLRASVLQEQGELGLAAAALEKALYLDPDFVLAHLALADLADRAGRTEKAGRHLTEALRSLRRRRPDDVIAEAEGLTARRLIAMVEAMQIAEGAL